MSIFIIHGAYGTPEENWFPWLKSELEKVGQEVFVPAFPTPEEQNLGNWMNVINTYTITEDSIFVGHSIACAFILSVTEKYKIKAAFLVAGWTGPLHDPIDEINRTIAEREFDWEKIKENCNRFVLFNSDNDPYVPLVLGKKLAVDVRGELNVIKGAGHFNIKAGYKEFEELKEKIISLI